MRVRMCRKILDSRISRIFLEATKAKSKKLKTKKARKMITYHFLTKDGNRHLT